MMAAGRPLPAIPLRSTLGGTVDLSAFPGQCVVYFYPWTGRPGTPNPPGWDHIPGAHGSTPQAEGFRDRYARFQAAGWAIYGVSGLTSDWQREFADRLKLPFALLSDHGFAFAEALNLPRFSTGGVAYLERLTLLVRDGAIVETVYPVANPASHATEILDKLRSSTRAAPT